MLQQLPVFILCMARGAMKITSSYHKNAIFGLQGAHNMSSSHVYTLQLIAAGYKERYSIRRSRWSPPLPCTSLACFKWCKQHSLLFPWENYSRMKLAYKYPTRWQSAWRAPYKTVPLFDSRYSRTFTYFIGQCIIVIVILSVHVSEQLHKHTCKCNITHTK